ncbi:MAG: lamin tail domain-containing protein [Cyclobacteriaceae bacterium]
MKFVIYRLMVSMFLLCSIGSQAQRLKIYHIDVDQADATLFIAPNGSTLLVDAGENGKGRAIKKILDLEGINRIDYFVNTHYHKDHYGGIDELVDAGISVGVAYDRGDKGSLPPGKLSEGTFKDYQRAVGNRAVMLTRGMQIPLDNTMSVTCISHGGVVLAETNPVPGNDENDMSISLLITYSNFRYFVGGDIEGYTERKIAERDLVLDLDVYQANHHGSSTSSTTEFMHDIVPTVVVISNGNHNGHAHPNQVTLDAYTQLVPEPTVFQTNKFLGTKPSGGNVSDDFIADLDAVGDEGTVTIVVDPGQGNYTVAYRDEVKNFPIKQRSQPHVQANGMIIEKLMVDPAGADATHEYVVIKNKTSSSVPLSGWTLRDASGRIWILDNSGQLLPDRSLKVQRSGMPMSMNNDGDIITLLNAENETIDEFQYVGSVEGIEIITGH